MILSDFKNNLDSYFPQLHKHLGIHDDDFVYDVITKIVKCVGFQPLPLDDGMYEVDDMELYLDNLWRYMILNKDHYNYWIL